MKTKNQIIGKRGEEEACSFLIGEGHRILRRNWRAGHLEVQFDIVAVVFAEPAPEIEYFPAAFIPLYV